MKSKFVAVISVLGLLGCQQGKNMSNDRSFVCGDKPNCVSTQEIREQYQIQPLKLLPSTTLSDIEKEAVKLVGAKIVQVDENYLHIECTTKIMRFVDDVELQLVKNELWVRSKSRVGYSDFGVNRKRAEELRALLTKANLIQ